MMNDKKKRMMTHAKSQSCCCGMFVRFSCCKAWGPQRRGRKVFRSNFRFLRSRLLWVALPACWEIRLRQPCVIIAHELCGSGVGKYKQRAKIRVPFQPLLVPDKMFSLLAAFAAPDGIGAMPTFVSTPPLSACLAQSR